MDEYLAIAIGCMPAALHKTIIEGERRDKDYDSATFISNVFDLADKFLSEYQDKESTKNKLFLENLKSESL